MGNLKVRRIAVLGLAALLLSACAGNGEFRQSTVPVPPPADPVSSQLRTVLEHTDLLVFSHPIPEAKIMQPVSGKRAGIVEAASAINDGEVPSMVTPKGWYAWLGGIARGTGQAEGADATAAGHETARSVLGDPDLPAKLSARFTRELRGEGLRA
ncbi:MAG: hypothetical protein OEY97_09370 [Nitrospirota bacterium]|nr:hypothetical protein [Nitrospirota bacterium]